MYYKKLVVPGGGRLSATGFPGTTSGPPPSEHPPRRLGLLPPGSDPVHATTHPGGRTVDSRSPGIVPRGEHRSPVFGSCMERISGYRRPRTAQPTIQELLLEMLKGEVVNSIVRQVSNRINWFLK